MPRIEIGLGSVLKGLLAPDVVSLLLRFASHCIVGGRFANLITLSLLAAVCSTTTQRVPAEHGRFLVP
jgi:hypothetical protein